MEGLYTYQIPNLPALSEYKYENIFKVFQNTEGYYFYNIIKKISFPDDIDQDLYTIERPIRTMPYTALSYDFYKTIDLWWLICLVNKISNPLSLIEPGTELKIIKPIQVSGVIDKIKEQLK
jgi:hypothetical protein